ncbi:MAG TPA: amidohydrolase family protein [Terriglobales bacterium]|nr:amidohydrolase family protein [Terriglobales bacterium]
MANNSAIDVMYFPPARQGLVEAGAGEPRCHEPVERALELLNRAGLEKVLISQCKRWSCERRWMCEDAALDDVLRYTLPYPQKFVGIAGYSPHNISQSLQEAETAVKLYGFRGVHVHPGSFGLSVNDRRMYPLYAKAAEWHVPVILDMRHLRDFSDGLTPAAMARVLWDFETATFVVAQSGWLAADMERLAERCENVCFAFDSHALRREDLRELASLPLLDGRCLWGSNGYPWEVCLPVVQTMPFPSEVREKLLRENARRIFGLERLEFVMPRAWQPAAAGKPIVAER